MLVFEDPEIVNLLQIETDATEDDGPDHSSTGNLATGTQIQRLLQKTLAANPGGKVRVHTIYVGSDTNREAVSFLRRLALAHSGTFRMASR